jgi:hypothetical protein
MNLAGWLIATTIHRFLFRLDSARLDSGRPITSTSWMVDRWRPDGSSLVLGCVRLSSPNMTGPDGLGGRL